MNFGEHLAKAAAHLAVLAESRPSERKLLQELRAWYREDLQYLYSKSRSYGIDWLLSTPIEEIPVTQESAKKFTTWAANFEWRDRHDFIDQVNLAVAELTIYRDNLCSCEQYDCIGRELWIETDRNQLVSICTSTTGGAYSLDGALLDVENIRPAKKSELSRELYPMDAIERIRRAVHPHPYPDERSDVPGTHRVFVKRVWGCPYNLCVASWTDDSAKMQLAKIRKSLARTLKMIPFVRAGGTIVLWLGPETNWRPYVDEIRPDKTSLHANIVQGLVWLDPETGVYHLSQSQWGSIKFGNLSWQFTALQETLENWTNSKFRTGPLV